MHDRRPSRRPGRPEHGARRLAVLLGAGLAALTTAVATGASDGLDERVRSEVAAHDWRVPHGLLVDVVHLGDADVTTATAAALVVLVVLLRRPWDRALRLVLVCLAAAAVVSALKATVDRTGSYDLEETPPRPGQGAYPSGHVAAVLVVSAMAVWALGADGGPVGRARALAAGAALGAVEAVALLLLQQHWLTDLVSGWLLGLLLVLLGTTALGHRPPAPPRTLRPLPQKWGNSEGPS